MAKKAAAKKKAAKKKSTSKKKSTRKKAAAKPSSDAAAKPKRAPKKRGTKAAKAAAPASSKPAPAPPPQSNREFPDLIEAQPDEIRRIARSLRGLVIGTLSNVVESIVGSETAGLAVYKRSGKADVLCGIQPVGDACLLYVQNVGGNEAEEVRHAGLELRGTGKNSRHVRFESLLDIAHEEVRSLLQHVESSSGATDAAADRSPAS